MQPTQSKSTISGNKIIYKRLLNAPIKMVFDVWTNPEHLAQWWGPEGFSLSTIEHEIKVGGIWRFTMHGPDGVDYPNKIQFLDIDPPKFIKYKHVDDYDVENISFEVTVEFKEKKHQTALTMTMIFPSQTDLNRVVETYNAFEGGKQNLARLSSFLEDKQLQ